MTILCFGETIIKKHKELFIFLGAFLCSFLWGSAFPCIKIGYKLMNIGQDPVPMKNTADIIIYAGERFTLAGILVVLIISISTHHFLKPLPNEIPKICFLSLFQTIGQYILFYLGLSCTTGVSSSIITSLGAFVVILMACFLFRTEKMTSKKIIGCTVAFLGVFLSESITLFNSREIPAQAGSKSHLTGNLLVFLAACCYAASSNMIKRYSKNHDTSLFSGYQFTFGGIVMIITGLIMGGSFKPHSLKALLMLIYLALISAVAYTLWSFLLKNSEVSKISVYGFMNPVIGVILSAFLLREKGTLSVFTFLSLILVGTGIYIVNHKPKSTDSN